MNNLQYIRSRVNITGRELFKVKIQKASGIFLVGGSDVWMSMKILSMYLYL